MLVKKRQWIEAELTEGDTTKFRKNIEEEQPKTCMENLSNELFYEIFDYLEGCELYHAFTNLNSRFQSLLAHSTLRLLICHGYDPNDFYSNADLDDIVPNPNQILSLSIFGVDDDDDDSSEALNKINSLLSRLESITLTDIKIDLLLPLLINLIELPRLSSLSIVYDDEIEDISNIYEVVVNLPMLTYFKLKFLFFFDFTPTPILQSKTLSNIKYLVMKHDYALDALIILISHMPQLSRLVCHYLNESNETIRENSLTQLPNLKSIIIHSCWAEFDEMEMFLTKVSAHVEELNIRCFRDTTFLDANRWERIISRHLLQLNKFRFRFKEPLDDDLDLTTFHGQLNQFNSMFWTKRKLLFRVFIEEDDFRDLSIVYSISPNKCHDADCERNIDNGDSFIDEINKTIFQSNDMTNQLNSDVSCRLYAEQNQLVVLDFPNINYDELITDCLSPVLDRIDINCLTISLFRMFIGTLIGLLKALPKLDSLIISSLSVAESRRLFIEETTTFSLISTLNIITKVCLKTMNDLAPLQFLLDLCPRVKYLEVDCTHGVLPEQVVRFVLLKTTKYISDLCILCMNISQDNVDEVNKIKHTIDLEQLCRNYAIKQICKKIYLRLRL